MPSLSLRRNGPCVPVALLSILLLQIAGSSALHGQSSSYHFESRDWSPGYTEAMLVNDSEKSIEAFAGVRTCPNTRQYARKDILDFPHGVLSDMLQAAGPGRPSRTGVLEPGGRWQTEMVSPIATDCDAQITALLFSDGSFEGQEDEARRLKADRDGVAASVNYWVERIKKEKPDGSTLAPLFLEVKQRIADDKANQVKYPSPYLPSKHKGPLGVWDYWAGRLHVDTSVDFYFPKDFSKVKPSELMEHITKNIDDWKAKIDGNETMQKLNSVFPPISDPDRNGNPQAVDSEAQPASNSD